MSEHINVDHAFDPEARKAQAEFDAYLETRPFVDDKGNLHEVGTNKFAKKSQINASFEQARDNHYDQTLAAEDYSGESLEQLAKRVARARAEGDKTRAIDAEDAFFDKFTAMSEKYGWDEDDDSANDTHRVDKDAKVGRSTIDDRLARYSKIMYGEDDTAAKSPEVVAKEDLKETDVTEKESVGALEEKPEEAPATAEKKFDVAAEVEQAKERLEQLGREREEQANEARNDNEAAKADRELIARVSKEGLEDLDDEPRIKRVSIEGLEAEEDSEISRVSTEGLEDEEIVEPARPEKGFLNRARQALNKSKELYLRAAFEFGHVFDKAKDELTKRGGPKPGETQAQYERRMRRNGQGVALGIVAIAGASIAAKYGAFDGIFDTPANGSGTGEGQNNTEETIVNKNPLVDHMSREQIGDFKIPEGSGGEALMDRLGVDKQVWYDNQNEFLRKFPNEAYRMSDGNVGFADNGRLTNDAIKFWAKKSDIWH